MAEPWSFRLISHHKKVPTAPRRGTMKTSATFGSQVRQGCVIIIRTKYLEAENSCLRGVSQNLLKKKRAIFRHFFKKRSASESVSHGHVKISVYTYYMKISV